MAALSAVRRCCAAGTQWPGGHATSTQPSFPHGPHSPADYARQTTGKNKFGAGGQRGEWGSAASRYWRTLEIVLPATYPAPYSTEEGQDSADDEKNDADRRQDRDVGQDSDNQ